jgi:hypothetical protein
VTFSLRAYTLAISLLFPLAAALLVSRGKQRRTQESTLQSSGWLTRKILVDFALLVGAWVVAWIPELVALALSRGHGAHAYAPEVLSLLLAHLLRGVLFISVAMLAAAVTSGAAAAGALTLAFTLASWALDLAAQAQDGPLQLLAELAPEGMLRAFERGDIRLNVIAVLLVTALSNLAVTVVWMHPRLERERRWAVTLALLVVTTALTALAGDIHTTWNVSKDRPRSGQLQGLSRPFRRLGLRDESGVRVIGHFAAQHRDGMIDDGIERRERVLHSSW